MLTGNDMEWSKSKKPINKIAFTQGLMIYLKLVTDVLNSGSSYEGLTVVHCAKYKRVPTTFE